VTPLSSRNLVTISASIAFFPRRTLLAPPTLLLPKRLELHAELEACVKGDLQSGKVRWGMGWLGGVGVGVGLIWWGGGGGDLGGEGAAAAEVYCQQSNHPCDHATPHHHHRPADLPLTIHQIEWIMLRPSNVPLLPGFIRSAAGQLLAFPLHMTEPVWSLAPVWPLLGESFWADKRKVSAWSVRAGV